MATTIISECLTCGQKTSSRPERPKKFCSKACYWQAQREGRVKVGRERKHVYPCAQCGIDTHRTPATKRNGDSADHVFCSRACYDRFRSQAIKERAKPCETCGADVTNPRSVYCSWQCRRDGKRPKPIRCVNCGAYFSAIKIMRRKAGIELVAVTHAKTCSRACHLGWIRNNPERKAKIGEAFSGVSHPNWQGGSHRMGFRGAGWHALREKVRERANHACEHCGMPESEHLERFHTTLNVNHKVPIHQFQGDNERANKMSNLEALCKSCHMKADWRWRKEHHSQMYLAGMFRSWR